MTKPHVETQHHYKRLPADNTCLTTRPTQSQMEFPEQQHTSNESNPINFIESSNQGKMSSSSSMPICSNGIDHKNIRYPHCIVWTPIPCLSWMCPLIGHMGIGMTSGVIRDFAGPYFVSEDSMAFGNPTRYLQLPLSKVPAVSTKDTWDQCVYEASEIYKGRMHNLCCDNCHSHVACALNKMHYDNSTSWNMIKVCFLMMIKGKNISVCGWLKQWLPFLIMMSIIVIVVVVNQ